MKNILKNTSYFAFSDMLLATFSKGFLRLDAVLIQTVNGLKLSYEVLVKAAPESKDWICYDNFLAEANIGFGVSEMYMQTVLERYSADHGLSFTECNFEVIKGKPTKKESKLLQAG